MFWSASERPAAVMPWWETLFDEDVFDDVICLVGCSVFCLFCVAGIQ
jgi:hypothetical protein